MKILYSSNKTDIEDFIEFASLKNKICWNSTFSYWAAFIGNVLYENSYKSVYAPSLFTSIEPVNDHLNPQWNSIKT